MPKPRPEASGLAEIVAGVERDTGVSPLYLPTETCRQIGISRSTLVRWRKGKNGQPPRLPPFAQIERGNQAPIPIYGPAQIAAGRALRGTIPPGPRPTDKPIRQATSPNRKVRLDA